MVKCLGFDSTLILYGLLSEKPAGNIDSIDFMGMGRKIESYLLTYAMAKMTPGEHEAFVKRASELYSSDLVTVI